MRTMYNIEDRPTDRPSDRRPTRRPTDLAFCKISNSHISATGHHPIHFMFGSREGFRGRRIEWTYFRLDQIEDGGAAILENFE